LEQYPKLLDSVVFNNADPDENEDASVYHNSKARVEKAIQQTIEMLKEAAEDMDHLDESTKHPLTQSLVWLLRKNDVSHFISHYLHRFPAKVLALFKKEKDT
jgi:hypothetical protein